MKGRWQIREGYAPLRFFILTLVVHSARYELSVSKESQGLGLGCALVTALESIGKSIDIRKVMLTVLKGQRNATATVPQPELCPLQMLQITPRPSGSTGGMGELVAQKNVMSTALIPLRFILKL